MVPSSKPDLRVAIDFGTTYTGVAWLNPNLKHPPTQVISDWPGGGSGDAGNERKVPSIIAKHADQSGFRRWGFLCDEDTAETDKWRYLKVFLEPRVLENARKNDTSWAPRNTLEVHQLVTEYLSHIYAHVKKSISIRIGQADPRKWDDMAIEFVFSVPTTWEGQDILEDFNTIIRKAGFGVPDRHEAILGLTEAEAAAVASMNHVGSSIPFTNGDVFLSIDAGGGTTDLAFVKILSTSPPTLEQIQDVRGTGIGSRMIDMSFQQLVSERLQAETDSRDQLPDDLALQLAQSSYYKSQKHRFGDSLYDLNLEAYRMPILGVHHRFSSEELGIEAGHMLVPKEDLVGIFDVQIDKILDLLKDALDRFEKDGHKYVKYVILSGGLGSSAYVLQRLHQYIETSDRSSLRGTKVQMCAEPQLVVAKGLLLEQFNKTLRTRIARASYGIIAPQRYSEKAGHFSPHIVVDCFDDHKYVMDRIHWFVKRGEKMASGAVLTVPIERRVALDEPLFFKEMVVSCDNPDGCVPENMTDPGATKMYELRADLTDIPPERLVIKKKRQRLLRWKHWKVKTSYYVCRYEVQLTVGPSGDLRFAIKYDGETLPGSGAPEKVQIQSKWDTTQNGEQTPAVELPELGNGLTTKLSLGSWESASKASLARPSYANIRNRSLQSDRQAVRSN